METEKIKKVTTNLTIDPTILKRAKAKGFNLSKEFQKLLEQLMRKDIELEKNISFCCLCVTQKDIEEMYKMIYDGLTLEENILNEEGKQLYIFYFVCEPCLKNLMNGKTDGYKKEILLKMQRVLSLANQEAEKYKDSSLFEYYLGRYLPSEDDFDDNSITDLISDIKARPFLSWDITPGRITITCKDFFGSDWEGD